MINLNTSWKSIEKPFIKNFDDVMHNLARRNDIKVIENRLEEIVLNPKTNQVKTTYLDCVDFFKLTEYKNKKIRKESYHNYANSNYFVETHQYNRKGQKIGTKRIIYKENEPLDVRKFNTDGITKEEYTLKIEKSESGETIKTQTYSHPDFGKGIQWTTKGKEFLKKTIFTYLKKTVEKYENGKLTTIEEFDWLGNLTKTTSL